ncbi:hypothetical protein [Capnocytophaga sp.]|uniref:hypothetical protein n=1 Tax=Capnocytophaga sp. TaxID=44737 RepID=UPI0026DB498D|nr:hypothetical protein [Capnocytophaga sp.]MDO5106146.1 hypothetical protein [Capnocytophaga sp.]
MNKITPKNLYELLQMMQLRLGMYISPPTLPSLWNFVLGYKSAFWILGKKDDSLDGFDDFVAKKLGFYESTAGFVNMILAHTQGFESKNILWDDFLKSEISSETHQKAITLFFSLLEAFYHEKKKKI